jgi:hypothetical protein
MAWIWLKAVPWATIISNAPALVDSTRRLIDKLRTSPAETTRGSSAPVDATSLQQRVVELQMRQRQMAELLESLANSNQQLTEAITYLRARVRLNFRIAVLLAIGYVGLVIFWLVRN